MNVCEKSNTVRYLGPRLKGWRKSLSLKAGELAALIAVAPSSLSAIENKKSLPSGDTLASLCMMTEIDVHWLLTGRRGKIRPHSKTEAAKRQFEINLLRFLKRCLQVYLAAGPATKIRLEGYLKNLEPE